MSGLCLDNMISGPTYFTKSEGKLIDLMLVKNSKRFMKSINVFCGYSDWHHMVGCIKKLHIPLRVTYKHLKVLDLKDRSAKFLSHICSIFDDVSRQYWSRYWLFSEILSEYAPLKDRATNENHVPYMNANRCTNTRF